MLHAREEGVESEDATGNYFTRLRYFFLRTRGGEANGSNDFLDDLPQGADRRNALARSGTWSKYNTVFIYDGFVAGDRREDTDFVAGGPFRKGKGLIEDARRIEVEDRPQGFRLVYHDRTLILVVLLGESRRHAVFPS